MGDKKERKRLLSAVDEDLNVDQNSYGTSGNLQSPTEKHGDIIVYRRRWYIVGTYSLMMFCIGGVCNSYGAIANASERAFDWNDSDIALLGNWQPIAFVISMGPFAWLMDVKGLRISCVLSAGMMALGSGLRCITGVPPAANWLNNVGNILIGMASPVAFSGPSLVSSTWFPVHQRTTGTAIASIAYGFGPALVFVFGPMLVPVRFPPNSTVGPDVESSTTGRIGNTTYQPDDLKVPFYIQQMRDDILLFNYIQFGACALCFLMMLVYFPNRPPTPPSTSAGVERVNFRDGLRDILRNQRFWILGFVYSATNGLYTTFAGMLDIDLKGAQVPDDQEIAGFMVLYSVIGLTFVGIVVARVADKFIRRIKMIMILLCIISALLLLWFTLIVEGILPANLPSLYISFVMGGIAINAAVPLFYELACECTYPVAEGLTNGVLNLLNNIFSMFFLFALMIPNIGTSWMNWTMVCSVTLCVPILIPYKQRFGRRELDKESGIVDTEDLPDVDEAVIHTPTRKIKPRAKKKSKMENRLRAKTIVERQGNDINTPVVSIRRSRSVPDNLSDLLSNGTNQYV